MIDRNCLSHWFPRLQQAGLPVPKTQILRTELDLSALIDGPAGKLPEKDLAAFLAEIRAAGDAMGWPCFLRTGHTARKHDWRNTCFLDCPEALSIHLFHLIEFSAMSGLPCKVWAVRELLPVVKLAELPAYGEMPLVKELRGFVRDGQIECCHPYWPAEAIRQGWRGREAPENLEAIICAAETITADYAAYVQPLLQRAAEAFAGDGAWSVDVLKTKRGWFVTDMADAARSWHWPDCPNCPRENQR